MPAKLLLLVQTMQQQCRSISAARTPFHGALDSARTLMCVTEAAHRLARALVPAALLHKALQCVAQLLQQLPQCGALLPTPTPGTCTASGSSSSSSSSSSAHECYFRLQVDTKKFLSHFVDMRSVTRAQLDEESAACMQQLLLNHAVQELLLQQLVGLVALLHQHHELEWQQQQQQQQQQRQQQRSGFKELMHIPAFHQDMLQLLPGGHAYLDAAAVVAVEEWGVDADVRLQYCRAQAAICMQILGAAFKQFMRASDQRRNSSAPALSAAAVRLTLQLQLLLAAGQLQRQQQQQQFDMQRDAVYMLTWCNNALVTQLQAAVQAAGGSCLPPEVLQQAGLQLLQALAAPVQQLQSLMAPVQQPPPDHASLLQQFDFDGDLALQLYAFMAAAAGLFVEQQVAAGRLVWIHACITLRNVCNQQS
jgi:hypothetical protein